MLLNVKLAFDDEQSPPKLELPLMLTTLMELMIPRKPNRFICESLINEAANEKRQLSFHFYIFISPKVNYCFLEMIDFRWVWAAQKLNDEVMKVLAGGSSEGAR